MDNEAIVGLIRIEAQSEQDVRLLAQLMDVQLSVVKDRGSCWHGYGSKVILNNPQMFAHNASK